MNDVKPQKPKKNTVTLTVFENLMEKFGIKKAMIARLANVLASNLEMMLLVNTNATKNKKNDATVLNTAMVNQSTPSNVTQPMLAKTSNAPVLWAGSPMDTNLVLLVFDLLKTSNRAKTVKPLSTTLTVVATPENALNATVQKLTTSNVMPIKKTSGLNTNTETVTASKNLANVNNALNHPKKPVPLKKTATTCTDSTKSQLLKVPVAQPTNANKFQNVFQKTCHVANVNPL
jgi:hypothetical protein